MAGGKSAISAWMPADAPRWNPLALKESGFGRTVARALTEQANASYHHGLLERRPPMSTNPARNGLMPHNAKNGISRKAKHIGLLINIRLCPL